MATDIEIFVGTSQDFLLSFKVKKTENVSFMSIVKEIVLNEMVKYSNTAPVSILG